MAHYLDPKNDLIFKRIFSENPDLLINFLNALIPFEQDRHIVNLEYLSNELVPENPGKKYSIVDVRIVVESKLNGLSLEQIQSITKSSVEQISKIIKRHKLL
jgi:predicted transposase/invertase (TIGR01784 family)